MDKKKQQEKSGLRSFLSSLLIAVVIAFAILQVIKPVIVSGPSMQPTLQDGDYLIVSKVAYLLDSPKRGDVIVFTYEEDGQREFIVKRVIAVPGDTICITGGDVFINGKKDPQRYTKDHVTDEEVAQRTVAKGHYFCMGDNRFNSMDSRDEEIGEVAEDLIVGRVAVRLLPIGKIGPVRSVSIP